MQIANPIYDVVFKFLMEDSKIAKLLISSIIKQDIEIIDFKPKEFTTNIEKTKAKKNKTKNINSGLTFFTVYRLDFTAKVKTKEGDKIVIIEIQKAKFPTDIMRFRKYLGEQYSNKENVYISDKNGNKQKKACEIISIYFLGHKLENIHGVPVIKSEKKYIDVSNGKEIKQKEYFIDSLNHESYIISIPELRERRRTELEILLSVFDQENRSDNNHILNVLEKDFPEKYRGFIRRLQKAASEPEIRKKMDAEDEIVDVLAEWQREMEQEKEQEKEQELAKKDVIIAENVKTIENKDKLLENKDKLLENKDKLLENKDKLLENKDKLIEELQKKIKGHK